MACSPDQARSMGPECRGRHSLTPGFLRSNPGQAQQTGVWRLAILFSFVGSTLVELPDRPAKAGPTGNQPFYRSFPMIAAAFYKFVALPDFAALKAPLLAVCEERGVKGTILLAA